MALEVIGAGFGRTGTMSLKLALERLGLGPCHHMADVLPDPAQQALWCRAAQGVVPDWDAVFAGYRSAVDWPAAHFWRELAQHYPDARIILTVRSFDSWYRSIEETLWRIWQARTAAGETGSFGVTVTRDIIFAGQFEDRTFMERLFHEHIATVQRAFPTERLLTYDVAAGWEPLCRFLGRPVPDSPFPRTNSTDEFQRNELARQRARATSA